MNGHHSTLAFGTRRGSSIVDSLVTMLVNKHIVSQADFHLAQMPGKGRGCFLTDQARRAFVAQFEHRMNTIVRHPRAGLRTTWRGCIDLQVGQFIQLLRDETKYICRLRSGNEENRELRGSRIEGIEARRLRIRLTIKDSAEVVIDKGQMTNDK